MCCFVCGRKKLTVSSSGNAEFRSLIFVHLSRDFETDKSTQEMSHFFDQEAEVSEGSEDDEVREEIRRHNKSSNRRIDSDEEEDEDEDGKQSFVVVD